MILIKPKQRLYIPGITIISKKSASSGGSGSNNWWNNNGAISGCICAYAAKGAADLASSYINLANPGTYNASPGVAPIFSGADGWTFNGSTQYLTTGITPSNNQAWSIIARFSDVPATATNRCLIGSAGPGAAAPYFGLIPRWSDGNAYYLNSGFLSKTPKANGVMAFAGNVAYHNGSAESGTITTVAGTPYTLFIAARNEGGMAAAFLSGKIQALAIYSTTLTAGEVATITTAIQAL